MIIIRMSIHKFRYVVKFLVLGVSFSVISAQIGFTEEEDMKKEDFQLSIDGRPVAFTVPPISKNGIWLVPLEPFAEQLGLKVEYPEGSEMAVLCGGVESELCVPLQFQDSKENAVKIDGVTYVAPTYISETFGFEIYKASANRLAVIHPMHLAPKFTLPDLQDTPRSLQDFRGKKTFLYVWGSW